MARSCFRFVCLDFPSFSEGLSLRGEPGFGGGLSEQFPFLFGGTFIEGAVIVAVPASTASFPFLFGGTFIEGFKCSIFFN